MLQNHNNSVGGKNKRVGNRNRKRKPSKHLSTEIIELTLGDPAHGGACVARDDSGRVVFVRHGLPGERVRAQITAERKKLAWADAIEILEASADRVSSVWPEAGPGGVGGGELSHVRPQAQRSWKTEVLLGQLRRIGGKELFDHIMDQHEGLQVLPVPGDEDPRDQLLHRRTRLELDITSSGLAGMHKYRSNTILPLNEMPLAVEPIGDLGLLGENAFWRKLWKPGDRVRVVSSNTHEPVLSISGKHYFANGEKADVESLLWTVDADGEQWGYNVSIDGFWQTHRRGAEVLLGAVADASGLTGGENVCELYAGAGLFTKVLAHRVGESGRVLSVEGEESAVADATDNIADFPWAETFVGNIDAEAILDISGQMGGRTDLLVMDPPRAGAGQDVCEQIAAIDVPRVVLVSCDPAAGARDVRAFFEKGYQIETLKAWDLFPHTHHMEFVSVLTKEKK